MPRLLQHFLASFDGFDLPAPDTIRRLPDEDIALGCECAHPSLQCEGWEPLPPFEFGQPALGSNL